MKIFSLAPRTGHENAYRVGRRRRRRALKGVFEPGPKVSASEPGDDVVGGLVQAVVDGF